MNLLKKVINAAAICLVVSILFYSVLCFFEGYDTKEQETPITKKETVPLIIDMPKETEYCNLMVYDHDGDVVYSCTGDVKIGKSKGNGEPINISIQIPYMDD